MSSKKERWCFGIVCVVAIGEALPDMVCDLTVEAAVPMHNRESSEIAELQKKNAALKERIERLKKNELEDIGATQKWKGKVPSQKTIVATSPTKQMQHFKLPSYAAPPQVLKSSKTKLLPKPSPNQTRRSKARHVKKSMLPKSKQRESPRLPRSPSPPEPSVQPPEQDWIWVDDDLAYFDDTN